MVTVYIDRHDNTSVSTVASDYFTASNAFGYMISNEVVNYMKTWQLATVSKAVYLQHYPREKRSQVSKLAIAVHDAHVFSRYSMI